jgi:hypothetical protein
MSRNVTVVLAGGAGADLGPNFNVTITGGTISPTTVTKASLSDGQTFSISSDAAETITITSTGVCTNPATIVIPAVTPSSPSESIYISGLAGTCSDFCTIVYTIPIFTTATDNYFNIGPGDTISSITNAGFYAIANTSTDTTPGNDFKVIETDNTGLILNILQCSGGVCIPL